MAGFRLSFSEDNVKKNPFDFPKLKLAKGETARLTIVEDPVSEYVHSIQKPILDDATGALVMTTKEKKDGTEYQVEKLTFVSNPICLGDREVLDAEGLDPENCPVCKRASEGGRGYYPKRRFAMHVIRTNTKPGTFDPNGTGQQLLIWAFTDLIFNKLVEINNEFGLADHDLKLGPCTDANFQKADLSAARDTVVDADARKNVFNDTTKAEDATIFCGNRKSRARIEEDLAQVDAVYDRAKGVEESAALHTTESLSKGLSAIISDDEDTANGVPTVSAEEVAPASSLDDLPAAKEEKKAEPAAKGGGTDLDDLFNNL